MVQIFKILLKQKAYYLFKQNSSPLFITLIFFKTTGFQTVLAATCKNKTDIKTTFFNFVMLQQESATFQLDTDCAKYCGSQKVEQSRNNTENIHFKQTIRGLSINDVIFGSISTHTLDHYNVIIRYYPHSKPPPIEHCCQ